VTEYSRVLLRIGCLAQMGFFIIVIRFYEKPREYFRFGEERRGGLAWLLRLVLALRS
jgi:hypothetical protein